MAYLVLEKLHSLYDGYRRRVRVGTMDLVLLQAQGQPYLFVNRCPHGDAPLHDASLVQHVIRCPLHGIEFDLRTGCALKAACVAPLTSIPLVYEGNTVGIDID
jgi:3-phenylpropionate/trans-cinnamate dioxygenase ferredoxin subunit